MTDRGQSGPDQADLLNNPWLNGGITYQIKRNGVYNSMLAKFACTRTLDPWAGVKKIKTIFVF